MKNENEIFKINGYEVKVCPNYPNYAVSRCGRVFRISSGKEMAQSLRGVPPYWYTRTCHNNVAKNVRVHRMIALTWIPNDSPDTKTQVNHKDGDKLNNSLENLEWVTNAQNIQHGMSEILSNIGENLYNATFTEEQVHEACKKLVEGYRTKDLAEEFGVTNDAMRKLKAGDTYFHIRKLYEIPHTYRTDFSKETVMWVCERINEGISDINISKMSTNKNLKTIDVKRIRHKIRYKSISDMFF